MADYDVSIFDGNADGEGAGKDKRLATQLARVFTVLELGGWGWLTLAEIARRANAPEASVSARLRDLRKPRFGGWTIDHHYSEQSGHLYRLKHGSGNRELVFNPAPAPRSKKAEARTVLREYAARCREQGYGEVEVVAAIEEVLR